MSQLQRAARLYLCVVVVSAVTLMLVGLRIDHELNSTRLVLAVAFTLLSSLAAFFELDFAFKTKVSLDSSVIFAVALLYHPGVAMLIIGIGVLIPHIVTRDVWYEASFNVTQAMLQVGAASVLLTLGGWQRMPLEFSTPSQVVLIPLAAATIYLVNTVLVAGIVALQTRMAFWQIWRQSTRYGAIEDLSQYFLGILAAATVDAHAWALPLFVLPGVAVYLSMHRQVQLRMQTVDAVEALADVVDLRDPYTANHSRRVAIYARELATALHHDVTEIELIERAARVHDVGKIIIDQVILSKEGRLTDDEWQQLKLHPVTGADILSRFPEFALATGYVRHHHESINGAGYPDGLAGDQIPLGSRVIAVADSFDAMASARPYRGALPREVVLGEFRKKRGKQWDAEIVDALLSLVEEGRIVFPTTADTPVLLDRHGDVVPMPAAL
jgi:HD-GYP domain-containing protein (c-di-GMP phosphodiesterase class II)